MLAAAPSGAAALGSNENPLGPSPRGVEAWLRAARCLHRYPDVVPAALCEAIASKHELDAARIECTHGAEQAIELIVRALVPPGDNVVAPALTFKMVEVAVRWAGAEYIAADLDGWAPDVDAVLAAVTERTRLVAVAAPNNPTGQTLDTADLLRLRQELPEQIPLVLDQAYAELDAASVHETGLKLCRDGANTVVVRTFSKAYGLAGARVGWFSGHTTVVERVRGLRCPFHLGRADAAAARAALDDDTHVAATVLHCDTWRARFREAIEA
ncbi:MAG: histidinol-phosphate transaminase, partial [Myxococcota bacterium]